MPKKNNPGCGCCGGCVIFTDGFSRADGTSLGNGWTEQSGDWEISGDKLVLSSPSVGNAATVSPTGDGNSGWAVTATLESDTDGDELGVLLSWTDASNCMYAMLKIHDTDATIKIVRVRSGTPTIQEDPVEAPTGMPHVVRIAYLGSNDGPHEVVAALNGRNVCGMSRDSAGPISGSLVGGTIAGSISGNATWDDVIVDQCEHAFCAQELEYIDPFDERRSFWRSYGTLIGGRLRFVALSFGSGPLRCQQLPDDPTGLTIAAKATVFYTVDNITATYEISLMLTGQGGTVGLELRSSNQFSASTIDANSNAQSQTLSGPVASGTTLEIRLIHIAGNVWDVEYYTNGNLRHTFTDVELDIAGGSVDCGVLARVSIPNGITPEIDNFEFTIT